MGARHRLSSYCHGIEWATLASILRSRVVRHRDEKNMNTRHRERSIQASHDGSHGRRGGLRGKGGCGCYIHLGLHFLKFFQVCVELAHMGRNEALLSPTRYCTLTYSVMDGLSGV
jgi:hypothetical protein